MYQTLKESYDKNIASLEKIINSRIDSVNIFFQCMEVSGMAAFSQQITFTRRTGYPDTLIEFLHKYLVKIKIDRSVVIAQIEQLEKEETETNK